MATLRERLAYYQKKETAFKKLQEENEQLKNQQETEKQALEEKNQALLEILNQKEHEIFELEEQLKQTVKPRQRLPLFKQICKMQKNN